MSFQNNPTMPNTIRRFQHTELTIEHNGFHAKIQENGKVKVSSPGKPDKESGDVVYDEIEMPASLIFKLSQALRLTRRTEYVEVGQAVQKNS